MNHVLYDIVGECREYQVFAVQRTCSTHLLWSFATLLSVFRVSGEWLRCCRGDETANTKIGSLELIGARPPPLDTRSRDLHPAGFLKRGNWQHSGKASLLVSNGRLQACRSFYEMLCVSQAQNACFLGYLQGLANGKGPLAAVQFIDYA